jgi:cytochrome c oxidase subunit 2
MLGTGAGAVLLFVYLTAPFLVVFATLLYLAVRRGKAPPRELDGSKRLLLAAEVAWLIAIGVAWTVINIVSIPWIPWLQAYTSSPPQSEPSQVVRVEAFMWGYTLSTYELKQGAVKFVARSIDTIHSMTIYSPRGEVIATVMLMPGMTEEIVVELKERGEYTIRCLEFCGDGHPAMLSKFRVV